MRLSVLVPLTLFSLLPLGCNQNEGQPPIQDPSMPGYGAPGAPGAPGYGAPGAPGAPGYGAPGAPGYGAPGAPGYGAPGAPGYGPAPGYGAPGAPGYGAPGAPGYGPAPGYGAPGAPGYGPAPGAPGAPAAGGPAQPLPAPMLMLAQQGLNMMAAQEARGMKPEGSAFGGQFMQEGQTVEQAINVQPGKCYTVIASGNVPVIDIQVLAQPLPMVPAVTAAQSQSQGSTAVVGGKQAGCIKNFLPMGGPAKVILKATRGTGVAAAQVYSK